MSTGRLSGRGAKLKVRMSRLYLHCVLCARKQADGLLAGAARGAVPPPGGAGFRGEPGPELLRAGERALELGAEAELVEAVGDAADAIIEVATRHGADLIGVGTREPSQVERLLGHSVSG